MLKQKAKLVGLTEREKTTQLRFTIQNKETDQLELTELVKTTGFLYKMSVKLTGRFACEM